MRNYSVTDALSMGVDIPRRTSTEYHDLGREGEARDYWFGDPITGEGAAYGDDDFHEGDPRKPDGYWGSRRGELHVVFLGAVGRGPVFGSRSRSSGRAGARRCILDYFNWLDVFLLGFWVMNTLMLGLFTWASGAGDWER